jgi:hypothetical protein
VPRHAYGVVADDVVRLALLVVRRGGLGAAAVGADSRFAVGEYLAVKAVMTASVREMTLFQSCAVS